MTNQHKFFLKLLVQKQFVVGKSHTSDHSGNFFVSRASRWVRILGVAGAVFVAPYFMDAVHAQDMSSDDIQVAMKVRKKLYAGGADEGELKVQTQLATPVRKMAPVQVEVEPAEPNSSTD